MKTKYYIEISESVDKQNYIMQSDWFDTKREAVDWANKIVWLDNSFEVYLMSSEFDEDEHYSEINCENKYDTLTARQFARNYEIKAVKDFAERLKARIDKENDYCLKYNDDHHVMGADALIATQSAFETVKYYIDEMLGNILKYNYGDGEE